MFLLCVLTSIYFQNIINFFPSQILLSQSFLIRTLYPYFLESFNIFSLSLPVIYIFDFLLLPNFLVCVHTVMSTP